MLLLRTYFNFDKLANKVISYVVIECQHNNIFQVLCLFHFLVITLSLESSRQLKKDKCFERNFLNVIFHNKKMKKFWIITLHFPFSFLFWVENNNSTFLFLPSNGRWPREREGGRIDKSKLYVPVILTLLQPLIFILLYPNPSCSSFFATKIKGSNLIWIFLLCLIVVCCPLTIPTKSRFDNLNI